VVDARRRHGALLKAEHPASPGRKGGKLCPLSRDEKYRISDTNNLQMAGKTVGVGSVGEPMSPGSTPNRLADLECLRLSGQDSAQPPA
jgi:hypothetical protein